MVLRLKRLRASALCVAEGQLLLVRLRDPVTGEEALYPPGGAIEAGAEPEAARDARRHRGRRFQSQRNSHAALVAEPSASASSSPRRSPSSCTGRSPTRLLPSDPPPAQQSATSHPFEDCGASCSQYYELDHQ
jgi:hypothetical protein